MNSPAADGVVVEIVELEETEVVRETMRRVAIFLSVFDVHTNRAPYDGRIIYRERRRGLRLDARNPEASVKNETSLQLPNSFAPSSAAARPFTKLQGAN